MRGFANVSRRSNIIIFWGAGRGGCGPVLESNSSPFLWGASLTSTPYITSTYKKGTATTPKSTILPRTLRNGLFFYFSHCVPEDIVQPNSKSVLKVFFLQRMSSKRKSHPMKILSDCHLFPSHRQPTGLQQNIFR